MDLSSSTISVESNSNDKTHYQQNTDDHQRILDEQLDWLTVDHDDLMQDILTQKSTPKYHPSMSVIDTWEQKTIERVRYTACLVRRALINALDKHVIETENKLNKLTPQLRDARHNSELFSKNDIQKWSIILQELKQIPMFLATINEKNSFPELTIDLRKETKNPHSAESKYEEKTSHTLTSIIRNPTPALSTPNSAGYQTKPTTMKTNTHKNSKTVKFDDTSSLTFETIMSGTIIIIRE
ncbi:unnamed protein product [Rotaria socialis]|uniref:Uncharacterized protein n=2 Tax=Rotaria socialis TaxID=392032 RepID=A0A817MP64_9BILA|nr:unnamed protein product [Rotaria socialis]CAF3391182.1 unnamed protein product [Rotaria socialis]CAF3727961.1 unnamed protein product [Rotaria socialis]CAF4442303.1 unnamed protein product [Rotaria socialis]CAF4617865.1 unnamed protein product [Rotaria socialis]